mgnify:CR=1 FL=1
MKFLFSNLFLLIFSVCFLYYLSLNSSFLPFDETGNIDIINISVAILLLWVLVFSFLCLTLYLFCTFFKKELSRYERIKFCLKISLVISFGLLGVLLLHLFHIIDWVLGIPLLILVLALIFVVS